MKFYYLNLFIISEPPLDEEDVPIGEWLCRRCKVLEELDNEENDQEENNQLEHKQEHDNLPKTELKEECCHPVNDDIECNPVISKDENIEAEIVKKPLDLLIKAARTLNPKQFQLPNELMPSFQLVGTSKKVNTNNRQIKRSIHELENGLVPFPVRTCFKCGMSCRRAPLIQCDFCPLLFHSDCLEIPLTVLPTAKWMCPNHPEHILEQKLLDSVSLTKRIKLWDKFSGRFCNEAIKVDFLKKIHRKNPPYRCKILMPTQQQVIVPNAVKEMYKNPLPLLKAPKDNQMYFNVKNEVIETKDSNYKGPTPEEQEQWLSDLIAFQGSVACYLASKHTNEKKIKLENENELNENSTDQNNLISNGSINSTSKICNDKSNELISNNQPTINGSSNFHEDDDEIPHENGIENEHQPTKIKTEESKLNSCKLSSVHTHDKPNSSSSSAFISFNNSIHSYIQDINDIELNKLDNNVLRLLAWQRLQQLIANPKTISDSNGTNHSYSTASSQTTIKRICLGDVRARAVLCPVFIRSGNNSLNNNISGPAIAMSYRTLNIGTGADNDVILGNYGFCNYVSNRHACIFYDEVSDYSLLIIHYLFAKISLLNNQIVFLLDVTSI